MLTVFRARNAVVSLSSSFNFSNAITMLLLVASCVDRSLLVDKAVHDYSAGSTVFETKIKTCHFCLIAHWLGFTK